MASGNGKNAWKNRIVGYGEEAPDQLLANPMNFRIHPKDQQAATEGSLDTLGWIDDVIVNKTTGHVVDGHLRVTLAMRNSEPTVPVKYVELTEAEEYQALLSLDPIAAMAATDKAKLDEVLHGVNSDDKRVQEFIAELAKREGLQYGAPPPDDPGAQMDKAEELREKWGVESGQMWRLGEHRLICGDCTDRAVVERVMQGDRYIVMFTDPPYGVSIGAKNRFLNSFQRAGRNLENIKADDDNASDLMDMLVSAFTLNREFMDDACSVFVRAPQGGQLGLMMMMMMMQSGLEVRHVINWVKNQPTFSLGRLDYEYQHEPILFTWKRTHKRIDGGRFHTSVWNVDKPRANAEHPTMKPIELPENAIANHSETGDIIGDIFLGSGTTLIACERLGRKCRAVEISPAYCAVAIQRWVDMTQGIPELVE